MKCPHCNSDKFRVGDIPNWHGFGGAPVECSECNGIYWVTIETIQLSYGLNPITDKIPSMKEGKWIYVFNEQHIRHLDPGVIVDKSHIHYRIEFTDSVKIWMPEHWIKPVPSEML